MILEIADELTAFEFDAACTFALTQWENKREAERLKVQLRGIACLLGAKPEDFRDDTDDDDDI